VFSDLVPGGFRRSLFFLQSSGRLAEPLNATGGTLRFRGTPVKNAALEPASDTVGIDTVGIRQYLYVISVQSLVV